MAYGCSGVTQNYQVTVKPLPDVTFNPQNLSVCSGDVTAIQLGSPVNGASFSWTASYEAGISGDFSGTTSFDAIIEDSLVNNNLSPANAFYSVTATAAGCQGPAFEYPVLVNPRPAGSVNLTDQLICSGGTTTEVNFSADVPGTEYTYSGYPSSAQITGVLYNQNGNLLASHILDNNGLTQHYVDYAITPSFNGCAGSDMHHYVYINPLPEITTSPMQQEICSGQQSAQVDLQSNIGSVNYSWTASVTSPNISLPTWSGNTNYLPAEIITNNGFETDTVIYQIIASMTNGISCPAPPDYYYTLVHPIPTVQADLAHDSICSTESVSITLSSQVENTSFYWTVTAPPAISGAQADSLQTVIDDVLINSGTDVEEVIYHIRPKSNSCIGPIEHVSVFIKPSPQITNNQFAFNQCSGEIFSLQLQANMSANFIWTATASSSCITGFSDGAGSIIQQQLTNSCYQPAYITYSVTSLINGCAGETQDFTVYVHPKPDVIYNPASISICSGQIAEISLSSNVSGTDFNYFYYPEINISGGNNGTGNQIIQTLDNAGINNANAIYKVVPFTVNCQGDTSVYSVPVHPNPVAGFFNDTVCFGSPTAFSDTSTYYISSPQSRLWTFGDGQSSTALNPSIVLGYEGAMPTKLRVTDLNGCVDSVSKDVEVFQLPDVLFSATENQVGIPTLFTDQSLPNAANITSWNWDFGDGNTSNVQNPSHLYLFSGTYSVCLQVTNSNACSDVFCLEVNVNPVPIPEFTFDTACFGLYTHFYDLSSSPSGDIATWSWDFGDGSVSSLQNPEHLYAVADTFEVRLIVTDLLGSYDTVWHEVFVHSLPLAAFESDTVCHETQTQLTDLSTTPNGSIQDWNWLFADGQASTEQNPLLQLDYEGCRQTCLIVSDIYGCLDTTYQDVCVDSLPEAYFTNTTVQNGLPTQFTDQSSPNSSSITAWYWTFGDGQTSAEQNPQHIYDDPGTYEVCLEVTNEHGCQHSWCNSNVVVHPLPIPEFTFDTACFGLYTHFYDLSSSPSGDIATWSWDFGDGSVSSLQNPEHLYAVADTFEVRLIVTDELGSYDTVWHEVFVHSLPLAAFESDTVCHETQTQLTDLSTTPNGSIQDWNWLFADGQASTEQNPLLQLDYEGCRQTCLIVSDIYGCLDTAYQDVCVDSLPEAYFTNTTVQNGLPTQFTDQSSPNSSSITAWYWTFGDGQTSAEQNPQHIYDDPGTYEVCLEVTNEHGCQHSWCNSNVVVHPLPVPEFTFDTACYGLYTHFYDLSSSPSGDIATWSWDFGDGSASSLQNPEHLYAVADTFDVRLIVTDELGSYDTVWHEVFVHSLPLAAFESDTVCHETQTQLTDLSTTPNGSIQDWNWLFADGQASTEQNPLLQLDYEGCRQTCLIVSDIYGCLDTAYKDVCVDSLPEPDFTYIPAPVFEPIYFTNTTVPHGKPVNEWYWDFGDGHTSTVRHPVHTYQTPGNKTVMLVATNIIGCKDTLYKNVSVYPLPEINFTFENVCLGNSTHFWDESILPAGTNVVYRLWHFGDPASGAADSSHLENPAHLYNSPGQYEVSLFLRLNTGAENYSDTTVRVFGLPQASYSYENICFQDYTSFADESDTADFPLTGWNWNFDDPISGALNYSDAQNPVHLFTHEGGDYNVNLMVTDAFGCTDDTSVLIHIDSLPEADFLVDTSCFKMNAVFTDISIYHDSPINKWIWNFDDPASGAANSSSLQNPSHTYSSPGSYYPRLIVESSKGCRDTAIHEAFVRQIPHPLFTYDTVCYGTPTTFTDLSTVSNNAAIVSWYWDFGNGISNLQNPVHILPDWGFNPVHLTLTDANGCQNDTIIQVLVDSTSLADFEIEQNCFGNMVHFINQSNPNGFTILDYFWDFGDSTYAYGYNTYHAYDRVDTFMVKLRVFNDNGCYDSIIKPVYVNPALQADFYADTACFGYETHFYDTAFNPAVAVQSCFWDFGDGNTANGHNPSHTYALAGVYNVMLTMTDTAGCTESVNRNVLVHHAPSAAYTYNPVCFHDTVRFADQSSAIDTEITEWYWNFGDTASGSNNYSNEQNPGHFFSTNDVYTVQLIVHDGNGCIDSIAQEVLFNVQPIAAFSFDTVCAGLVSQFYDLSSSPEGNIQNWQWDFGDSLSGNGNYSSDQNPHHTFSAIGVYDVSLVVENSLGCKDTITQEVFVKPTPNAAFSAEPECTGTAVSFVNHSAAYGPYHPIISWLWDFGDGTVDTLFQATHIYDNPGNYSVSLTAWDIEGCSNTYDSVISIFALPEPDFLYSSPCAGQECIFTDLSNGLGANIIEWHWDFDDPLSGSFNQSNAQNPGHIFVNTGMYEVKLGVLNTNGCYKEITKTVEIHEAPVALFDAETTCVGDSVYFQNLSYANNDSIVSWNWNFGDGNFSEEKNPVHIYLEAGIYGVSLTVNTLSSCSAHMTMNLEIASPPMAAFDIELPNCFGDSTRFLDQSVDPGGHIINSWLWDFDDGSYSTDQNPVHKYTTAGQKLIQLTVSDTLGCTAPIFQTIYVNEPPTANFSYLVYQCDSVLFTDYSVANNDTILSWYWDFDDPASGWNNHATSANPVHVFADEGMYNVSLVVSSGNGCLDTVMHELEIHKPVSDFIYDSVCYGNPTYFTELASSASGNIISYHWDFGDGNTSDLPNPSHIFSSPGFYGVSLSVTDYNGCSDIMQKNIQIHFPPTADFTTNTPLCSYDSVYFTNSSHGFGTMPLISYQWDFGDGTSSNEENPQHFYAQAGSYQVSLFVEDTNHCAHDTSHLITVYDQPNAAFNYSTNNCDTLFFFDASSGLQDIIYWHWDFGDPVSGAFNISTQQNPWHIFTSQGYFDVTLIATSSSGCSDTSMQTVYFESLPVVDFTFDTVCLGDSTHFAGFSSSPQINNWQWNFGDGQTGFGQFTSHLFEDAGLHQVVLEITNYLGCTNQVLHNVMVSDRPTALFTCNDSVCNGSTVSFSDQSLFGNTPLTNWLWLFGDGDSSTEQNPQHNYASSGTYDVWLTVTNESGCIDSVMNTVFVAAMPQAGFTFDTVCLGLPTSFIDTSASPNSWIVYRHWNFGDGTDTLNIQNPPHVYENPGTYNVQLVVGDYNGCYDTITQQVLVRELPVADFYVTVDSVCLGDTMWFQDASTSNSGAIVSWTWYFGEPSSGNADTSCLQNPWHIYSNPGTYYVLLIVENANGCYSEISKTVFVRDLPQAHFNWDAGCSYNPVSFYDLSTTENGAIISWLWDFGDGTTSTEQNPVHNYNISTDSSFLVHLWITDNGGCLDSSQQLVNLSGQPISAFSYEADKPCTDGAFHFTDLSSVSSGNIQNWLWLFGDGDSSLLQNPSHIYHSPGIYSAYLIIKSNAGCYDTSMQNIEVFALPDIDFSFDTVCFGDSTHFNSSAYSSQAINEWYWDFGDGYSSNTGDPYHLFRAPGIYQVILMAGDTNLCSSTITKDVFVRSLPDVSFSADTACFGFPTSFDGFSSSDVYSWKWDFGDSIGVAFREDTVYQYSYPGDYIVSLQLVDSFGCQNIEFKHVNVFEPPVAYFNYTNTFCDDGLVHFTDSSYGIGNQITDWRWEFEKDYVSFVQNPDYTFNQLDTCYDVQLIVHDLRGCVDTSVQQVCVKSDFMVSFRSETTCLGDTSWLFAHIETHGDSIANWMWKIGDLPEINTNIDSIGIWIDNINPQKVTLTATDIYGCIDSVQGIVSVIDTPHVAFRYNIASCYDTTFFEDLTQTTNGALTNWVWNFGDSSSANNTSSAQNPWHVYSPKDSLYHVSLTVENSFGCAGRFMENVLKFPCVAVAYNVSGSHCADDSLLFTEYSYSGSPDVLINQWEWQFDDGDTLRYSERRDSIWHLFNQAGYYDVLLIVHAVMEGVPTTDSLSKTIFVNPLPQPNFSWSLACQNDSVWFTNTSEIAQGSIDQYVWHFGDGTLDNMENPFHIYENDSTYPISLTAVSDSGCIDNNEKYISILPQPVPQIIMSDSVGCGDPARIMFSDTSGILGATYNWNFGDGSTAQTEVPYVSHDFGLGDFNIMIEITSAEGCRNKTYENLDVHTKPVAAFEYYPGSVSILEPKVSFTDLSYGTDGIINKFVWDFDGYRDSSNTHAYYVFRDTGDIQVKLMVFDNYGCSDTATHTIKVNPELIFQIANAITIRDGYAHNTFGPISKYFDPNAYEFIIFNRWGQQVFVSYDYENRWDATYNGKACPAGSYVWILNVRDLDGINHAYKGVVYVIK